MDICGSHTRLLECEDEGCCDEQKSKKVLHVVFLKNSLMYFGGDRCYPKKKQKTYHVLGKKNVLNEMVIVVLFYGALGCVRNIAHDTG